MAAQTLLDVTRNYDDAAISGLLNGESITLNNSNLIINSDVRWGQQSAVFGAIAVSVTLGGSVTLDGRDVWWIPFDASSGVVPALGTVGVNDCTGSIAGAGEFLGVFPTTMLEPLTAGASMPTSGFIKLRRKTISFVDNEIITFAGGATVTVNSATGGQVGWIHVVGSQLTSMTIPRLGKLTTIGNYFELGETSGLDDQTFQFPVADTCPAIQIETAVGSGVYEWWLNSGARWGTVTQFVSTDERGKYFGIDKLTGVITIAQRATNACGYKPIAGLKVRIPNIIVSSSSSANWNDNLISSAVSTRYDLITSSAGEIDIQHMCGSWYLSCTAAYSVSIKNSALLNILVSNVATKTFIDNVAFGLELALNNGAVTASALFSGISFKNVRAVRYDTVTSSSVCVAISDGLDVLVEDVQIEAFGTLTTTERGSSNVKCLTLLRCTDIIVNRLSSICTTLSLSSCYNAVVTDYKFADRLNGTTTSIAGAYAIELTALSTNILIDGYSPLFPSIPNLHPYLGIGTSTAVNNVEIRNVGTPSSKINGGTVDLMAIFFASSTSTNITIRRCYLENIRTNLFTIPNTTQNVTIENVWGDPTDVLAISAVVVTPKGCMWTPSGTVQSAVYGRHCEDSFTSDTSGYISFAANEPLTPTLDQCEITAGTPKFNSNGTVQMPTVGDQVVWTMPYFAIGHTKLGGAATTSLIGTLPGNIDFDYQIDTGLGFSSWKTLMVARTRSSGGIVGTNTITVTVVAGSRQPQIGDYVGVINRAIPDGTTVTNIVGGVITLSNLLTNSTGSGVNIFFWNDIEAEPAIDPATGVKLKIRATAMVAASTTAVSYIRVGTTTDAISQAIQYPLPVVQNEGKVSGIEIGSRIRIYNVTTATEIANEVMATTDWTILYSEGSEFTDEDVIEIRIAKTGYLPNSFLALATATGWAGLAAQEIDAVYTLNAIDGSTVTELTGDFPNIQIDSADADGETTVQRIYAWFSYIQTTEQGIRDFFEAMLAEDEVNYRIRATVANLKIDNTISTPLMVIGGRMYRDDGATVIAATSNSIQLDPDKAYAVSTSGSAPTTGEITTAVWSNVSRTLTSATIVRTELATELARIDVATSTRNAVAPDNTSITAIKAKTDTLVNTDLTGVDAELELIKNNTNIIPALL